MGIKFVAISQAELIDFHLNFKIYVYIKGFRGERVLGS